MARAAAARGVKTMLNLEQFMGSEKINFGPPEISCGTRFLKIQNVTLRHCFWSQASARDHDDESEGGEVRRGALRVHVPPSLKAAVGILLRYVPYRQCLA
jgi:hypothetical protein